MFLIANNKLISQWTSPPSHTIHLIVLSEFAAKHRLLLPALARLHLSNPGLLWRVPRLISWFCLHLQFSGKVKEIELREKKTIPDI